VGVLAHGWIDLTVFRLLKRQSAEIGTADILVIVPVADAAQNAMGANYSSITAGLLLVVTSVFWSHALNWLAVHSYTSRILESLSEQVQAGNGASGASDVGELTDRACPDPVVR
jgi:uncharacterized membrane protein YcaP (DUF421 family)